MKDFIPKWDTSLTDFMPNSVNFIDVTGIRFDKLVPLYPIGRQSYGIIWRCKCDCGNICDIRTSYLRNGHTRSCGCLAAILLKQDRLRGKDNCRYKGHEKITGTFLCKIKWGAKIRNIEFDDNLTCELLWELYLSQNKRCALSGIYLRFEDISRCMTLKTASLDRIDSSKGYIEGNVQWVHKDINKMKLHYNQSNFIGMCTAIVEYQMKLTNSDSLDTLKKKLKEGMNEDN
jgi:hypothetical protein